MKQPFVGASLENTQPADFARHGIPVPLYALDESLVLLFKSEQECQAYVSLLEEIAKEMQAADPGKTKSHIQVALAFIRQITRALNC